MLQARESQNKGQLLQSVCKDIILNDRVSSQRLLVEKVKARGIERVNQSRVSKILDALGAIKLRDARGNFYYGLVENISIGQKERPIDSVVVSVTHNEHHILIKTAKGGSNLIANILESNTSEFNIMGCFCNESAVLVIPLNTAEVDSLSDEIKHYFKLPS